jgi:hypothetical protein
MKNKLIILILANAFLLLSVFHSSVKAQGTITIDHKTKRYIGDVSTLNRSKYTNGHFLNRNTDADFNTFKTTYNIPSSYIGSRSFWNPFHLVKDGVIPNITKNKFGVRSVDQGFVATGTENNLFYDKTKDYSTEDISAFSAQAADYVARNYRDNWNFVPNYIEPLNEPMVHAVDHYPEGRQTPQIYITSKIDAVITKMCQYHKDLGQAIHNLPELQNMKVMGYASAFPEFEGNDFTTWNKRYKKFIDIAGADVDVFSVHLYDGSGINNSGGRRSGSNSEAILDIIETYSYIALGKVKPIAITEYGRLVPNQTGWSNSSGTSNYEPITNAQAVRSQIHMVMNFMERADHLELAIPFNVDTRDKTSQFSKSSIWINNSGTIELSQRKFFYEMLKDLKGDRVRIKSTNVDVQTQAFVDGNQLFILLNNLNDNTQTMNLNLLNSSGLQDVTIKRLNIFTNKLPELNTTSQNTSPSSLDIAYGETIVLTYNFDAPITFNNNIYSKKYYAQEYLKAITANVNNIFNLTGVDVGNGEATLRVSVGRSHGKSLLPIVTINGNSLPISGDIIRGYDQNNRSQFFGTLEIPVNMNLLNQGTNTINVKFSDGGGHISSVILQVQKSDNPLLSVNNIEKSTNSKLQLFPNPVNSGDIVYLTNSDLNAKILVFSLDGKEILNTIGNSIDTKTLTSGVYFARLKTDQNNFNIAKLLVK